MGSGALHLLSRAASAAAQRVQRIAARCALALALRPPAPHLRDILQAEAELIPVDLGPANEVH